MDPQPAAQIFAFVQLAMYHISEQEGPSNLTLQLDASSVSCWAAGVRLALPTNLGMRLDRRRLRLDEVWSVRGVFFLSCGCLCSSGTLSMNVTGIRLASILITLYHDDDDADARHFNFFVSKVGVNEMSHFTLS